MDSITAEGKTYDLSHLQTFDRQVLLSLRGKFTKTVTVTFKFSNHCYTREAEPGELDPTLGLIQDGSSHQPRYRIFDSERYYLSHNLVGLIDDLLATKGKVYEGKYHNVLKTEVLNGTSPISYVFFMQTAKKREQKKIEVHVESAYPYDPSNPPFSTSKPQSFMVRLSKTWSD
jgi:hypothetical protein